MRSQPPPDEVLRVFNCHECQIESIDGGEGRCWRAGGIVLKPCDNPVEWQWLAESLPGIPQDGFRIGMPVPARDGAWNVRGWSAQEALAGVHPREGRWGEVLAVGERFHRAISHLSRPTFLDDRISPWALGDRVAWEEVPAPKKCPLLEEMLGLRRPISLPSQVVHGDLSENVLFAEGLPPAVIDFSPYWRPVGFSTAIVVADAVCWRKADPEELLTFVASIDEFPQVLVRALIFRMVTTVAVSKGETDLSGYSPGVAMARRLTS